MSTETLPLEEMSIAKIYNGETAKYEVPIYQRNYAWEEHEIKAIVQDVYDACTENKKNYYIGTLVVFDKGDKVYEVIDGQQRLTTIFLILKALEINIQNKLTYRARKKSKDTLEHLIDLEKVEEKDKGIADGFVYAKEAISGIVENEKLESFKNYFQNNVHIICYKVPKDVDLNNYFEVMNSRGEQLEKHEIVKATLSQNLSKTDLEKFCFIWDSCNEMNVYIQQKIPNTNIFGNNLCDFNIRDFNSIPQLSEERKNRKSIESLITGKIEDLKKDTDNDKNDTFQAIIDFPNFLLIVLKITCIEENIKNFNIDNFILDDKELIKEFDLLKNNANMAKKFAYNLLKAKYFLDNYIVHHANTDDSISSNPWQLEYFYKEDNKRYTLNLCDDNKIQDEIVQLLSMLEVSFSPHQRKNYLFYCLLHLFHDIDLNNYLVFLRNLAKKYFYDIYMEQSNLNSNNVPTPGAFDCSIIQNGTINLNIQNTAPNFTAIYGDGNEISKGISLFVFNYLDYKIWRKYSEELRGQKTKEGDNNRKLFFASIDSPEFKLDFFDKFYFSRTRKSLEHFYPRAKATGKNNDLTQEQINCFGNYAMIGSAANSSGSDWDPKTKLDHYLDRKTDQVSVASIKLRIMMENCKKSGHWDFENIKNHQSAMVKILML